MSDDDVWQHMADMAGEDYQRELITEQVAALTAAIARVRALHKRLLWPLSGKLSDAKFVCGYCVNPDGVLSEWPCETIRALDGES